MAKQILAWGAQAAGVAPGAVGVATFDVSESGVSGRFVLDNIDGAVTLIRHRNKALTTGLVPTALFQEASQCNPRLRRFIQINDPLEVSVLNQAAGAVTYNVGLTAAPQSGQAIPYEGDALREYSRDLIAWGGDNSVDLAPGAIQQYTIQLLQAGRGGFIVVGNSLPTNQDLAITEITYDNIALLDTPTGVPANLFNSSNPDNPLWGMLLEVNHRLTITVRNDGAAPAESVAVCVTAG